MLELMSLVSHGVAAVGFCVHRVGVSDVMRVADAGQLLPPKVCLNVSPSMYLFLNLIVIIEI